MSLPTEKVIGIKVQYPGLTSTVSITVQKALNCNGGLIISEKADYSLCTQNAKIGITLNTLHSRVRV